MGPPDAVDERLRDAAHDALAVPRRTFVLPVPPDGPGTAHRRSGPHHCRMAVIGGAAVGGAVAVVAALLAGRRGRHRRAALPRHRPGRRTAG